jgi:hypothetical protein
MSLACAHVADLYVRFSNCSLILDTMPNPLYEGSTFRSLENVVPLRY